MALIYISSTYKDLIKERQAAAEAVRRLGHQVILMDDFVAADKRPVDKCVQDVRSCDVYIGIIAWRYGFIPDGYKKSITHLEYEAARESGKPCLIFLLDNKAPWPVEYVTTGEGRKRIDQFRNELMEERIVSFFQNAEELSALVSAAVGNLKLSKENLLPDSSRRRKLNPLASKMCDRIAQVTSFSKFFLTYQKKHPGRPQFYFLHGDELEAHESFIQRLMVTSLKGSANKKWGERGTIILKNIPWPMEEQPIEVQQTQLKHNLRSKFDVPVEDDSITAKALSRQPPWIGGKLIIIHHRIYSSKWDKETAGLLLWYIRDFWGVLDSNGNVDHPRFLVFFSIKYQKPEEAGLKQKVFKKKYIKKNYIQKELENIRKQLNDEYPCLLLPELTPVEIEDVLDWFAENDIYEEAEQRKIAGSIFRDKKTNTLIPRNMTEVELELQKIVDHIYTNESVDTPGVYSPDHKKGETLEKSFLRLFKEFFAISEEVEETILLNLRKQRKGSHVGHDISFECTSRDNEKVTCIIECKDVKGLITERHIAQKLLAVEASDQKIDHWILFSVRSDPSNYLMELLAAWKEKDKFPFEIHIWSPQNGIQELFGLEPDIYEKFYGNETINNTHPKDWTTQKKREVYERWKDKLKVKPFALLPKVWKEYMKNPGMMLLKEERKRYKELEILYNNRIEFRFKDIKSTLLNGTMEDHVRQWLEDKKKNVMLILGEFRTGKKMFTYFLSRNLALDFFNDPDNGWIPVRFSLSYYQLAKDPQTFLQRRLGEFNGDARSWNDLRNEKKKILVILNGFDKMSKKLDPGTLNVNIHNLKELCNYFKGMKILITSRSHFFEYKDMKDKFLKEFESPIILQLATHEDSRMEFLKAYNTEKAIRELIGKKTNSDYLQARSKLLTIKEKHLVPLGISPSPPIVVMPCYTGPVLPFYN